MALFIKKNNDYISPLDQCMNTYRRQEKLSVSQQTEIKRCAEVTNKMMQAHEKGSNLDEIWQDF